MAHNQNPAEDYAKCYGHSLTLTLANGAKLLPRSASEADDYPSDLVIGLGVRPVEVEPPSFKPQGRTTLALPAALILPPAALLQIPWQDQWVPTYTRAQWEALHEWLAGPDFAGATIVMHCAGGHGRTGTALAILATLSGACKPTGAGAFVRSRHCAKGIETSAQIAYLGRILGVKQNIAPPKPKPQPPVQAVTGNPPGGHWRADGQGRLTPLADNSFGADDPGVSDWPGDFK